MKFLLCWTLSFISRSSLWTLSFLSRSSFFITRPFFVGLFPFHPLFFLSHAFFSACFPFDRGLAFNHAFLFPRILSIFIIFHHALLSYSSGSYLLDSFLLVSLFPLGIFAFYLVPTWSTLDPLDYLLNLIVSCMYTD